MTTDLTLVTCSLLEKESNALWEKLYPSLRVQVQRLVFSLRVPSWRGQEYDIAEDIIQETVLRLLKYARKAESGAAAPIQSLESLMISVAYNYGRDLRRRDRRLMRFTCTDEISACMSSQFSLLEMVNECVYQEWLFALVSHAIAHFPLKQRKALLIDLANRMAFDGQPTPLQKAFLKEGIQLREYQLCVPSDSIERARHSSLLSQAYKRLALVFSTIVNDQFK